MSSSPRDEEGDTGGRNKLGGPGGRQSNNAGAFRRPSLAQVLLRPAGQLGRIDAEFSYSPVATSLYIPWTSFYRERI